MMRSGEELKAARKAVGLSQQRVAELAQCSVAYVRVLEGGYRPETGAVAVRVGNVLATVEPKPSK